MENTTKKSTTSENCGKYSDITTETSTGVMGGMESACSPNPGVWVLRHPIHVPRWPTWWPEDRRQTVSDCTLQNQLKVTFKSSISLSPHMSSSCKTSQSCGVSRGNPEDLQLRFGTFQDPCVGCSQNPFLLKLLIPPGRAAFSWVDHVTSDSRG